MDSVHVESANGDVTYWLDGRKFIELANGDVYEYINDAWVKSN